MDKLVEKYPYKKLLDLNWYEAAIAHLLLFKYLKERSSNNVYFLISNQGILLKATTSILLRNTQDEINKFFTAKIQQLQISGSSDFYEHIINDIKQQTDKLKDTRDCPYINLVYSQKLKHSCLTMKKYGYAKPYENWQSHERERRQFCYLIVRPQHRWKEIANNVLAFVKKRQATHMKSPSTAAWPCEMSYEKFIWLFLKKEFSELKKHVEIKEKSKQSTLIVTVKQNISEFTQMEKELSNLQILYSVDRPQIDPSKTGSILVLSSLQIQKITQLIYHQFGLPNFIKELRRKTENYLIICIDMDEVVGDYMSLQPLSKIYTREDMKAIKQEQLCTIYRIGKRHEIVSYQGNNYVVVKFKSPLVENIENVLSVRLPSLPRYYYWFQRDGWVYMMRKYESVKLKAGLEKLTLFDQVFIIESLILVVRQLHKRGIYVGSKFSDSIFVDGKRIMIQPGEVGSISEDISKLILVVREWVKNMKENQLKVELQRINDPFQMLDILSDYIDSNS